MAVHQTTLFSSRSLSIHRYMAVQRRYLQKFTNETNVTTPTLSNSDMRSSWQNVALITLTYLALELLRVWFAPNEIWPLFHILPPPAREWHRRSALATGFKTLLLSIFHVRDHWLQSLILNLWKEIFKTLFRTSWLSHKSPRTSKKKPKGFSKC